MSYQEIDPNALRPDINPADQNAYAIKAGYTGWNDYQDQQRYGNAPGGVNNPGTGGGVNLGGAFGGTAGAPTLDLLSLYKSLYGSSGIDQLNTNLTNLTNGYNKEQSTINDNPFLAEADRTGRISKLTNDYQNSIKPIQDQIATKKADMQMQLDLQTKQFDINSQATQQALSQFNSLLSSGALNNVSPNDIANITRATGLSSSIIQGAISSMKAKEAGANIKPNVSYQTDNEGNVTAVTIDENTGKVINQVSLGGISKAPKNSVTGGSANTSGGGTGSASDAKQFASDKKLAPSYVAKDAKAGVTLSSMLQHYRTYLTPQQIYTIYNQNSKYGPAKETTAQLKAMGIKK